MQNREPVIRPLPTEEGFRRLVDQIVTEENAKALAELILTPANLEDPQQADLALAAARHAFLVTPEFQAAFREWIGWPDLNKKIDWQRVLAEGDAASMAFRPEPELSMLEL